MHVDVSMVAHYVKKGGDNATEFRLVTHGHLKHAGKRAHTGEICTHNTIVDCLRIQHPSATTEKYFLFFPFANDKQYRPPCFIGAAIATDYGISHPPA